MLCRVPRALPPLAAILADLGNPSAAELARCLGVSRRTVERWLVDGDAPRPAVLALFWLTRWGQSIVECEAVNDAARYYGMVDGYKRQCDELERAIARLASLKHGAANHPSLRHAPALTVWAAG